ncbi:hypothetical protein [Streptomyces sp. NPDC050428]|uniref:hypothetical protein n=1 Tax=Streptomyces sp. NPDC050428 TaxID=3155757 RepID=UPI003441B71A
MPLDPITSTNHDHPYEERHPDAEWRAGTWDPVTESGEEPIRTLLRTAATYRPLEEVAALVMLLKRTGEVPNPGDEALRVAAVARPMDEVMQLVAMLNEPPHEIDEADTTLRAAAVGRPIEEVAQLLSYLGTHENEPPFTTAHRNDGKRPEPARAPQTPTLFDSPDEQDRRERDVREQHAREPDPHVAPWTSAPAGPPPVVPSLAPPAGVRTGAGSGDRTPSFALRSPLRSPLRRPAAVALLACGVIHLPTDFADLRSGGYADVASLVVTVLCLVVGAWLAMADTARIWAVSAATAVGIIAAHTLSGLGALDLLQSGLGAHFDWASLVAMGCAAVALSLAGLTLMTRQNAMRRAAEKAIQRLPRRPAPTVDAANDS